MRKTRFMSLLFLVLSIAFLFDPGFRQAFVAPLAIAGLEEGTLPRWLGGSARIPADKLEEIARAAEQRRNAQALAFVTLHLSGPERARRADQAVALDPQLTWIYYRLISRWEPNDPKNMEWVKKLEAWDPDNAVPYLLEAEFIHKARKLVALKGSEPERLNALAKEAEWRRAMEKAFAAPRYDNYARRWFELERTQLVEHGLARPLVVILSAAAYPIPDIVNIRQYANLQMKKVGKEAEQAHRLPEAVGAYWTVAHFGERVQLQSPILIERVIAAALQKDAYERLSPALRQLGRSDEAGLVDYARQDLVQRQEILRGKDPLAHSSNYYWSSLLVYLSAALVVIFGALTALAVLYVNAKRWIRPEKKGRIYQLITVAENYMPLLLFIACFGLYVSYVPFTHNFHHYMTTSGEIHDFEPLIFNVLPFPEAIPGGNQFLPENPFRPYIWYALGGFVLVVLLAVATRRRST